MKLRFLREKQGSTTLEFVSLLPIVALMSMVIWQMAVFTMAVMDTQSFVREEVRVAADDGDAKKAEKRGEKSFPQTDNVKLASYQVKKIEKEEKKDKQGVKRSYMEVTAKIKVKILFLSIAPIEYSYKAQSRIID
ncbi:TadE/TadG family type IV pilus assembly protein [Baia soyae]|uniref:TadE/TadG family type IV pilus assembly protein n=1 Tax=Baia soyae TaxID=1544746 RepID=UPI001050FB92|nr:hypothetical protein [Baia soyae]